MPQAKNRLLIASDGITARVLLNGQNISAGEIAFHAKAGAPYRLDISGVQVHKADMGEENFKEYVRTRLGYDME